MGKVYFLIKTTHPSYDLNRKWFEDISVYDSYPLVIKTLHEKQDEERARVAEVKRISVISYSDRLSKEQIFESQNSGHRISYKVEEKKIITE